MKIKRGVILGDVTTQMWFVIVCAAEIWQELGQELVITSARDGKHKTDSLHYVGYALDFRIRYFEGDDAYHAAERLQQKLGPDYQVILKPTHIHVEWDKAKSLGFEIA